MVINTTSTPELHGGAVTSDTGLVKVCQQSVATAVTSTIASSGLPDAADLAADAQRKAGADPGIETEPHRDRVLIGLIAALCASIATARGSCVICGRAHRRWQWQVGDHDGSRGLVHRLSLHASIRQPASGTAVDRLLPRIETNSSPSGSRDASARALSFIGHHQMVISGTSAYGNNGSLTI
ncbi:MAG: hypothetical protein IPO58_25260 [Betaproteobacteria bacterium]|nr:hypothetical protein [Betaproteobacteria bacterium]